MRRLSSEAALVLTAWEGLLFCWILFDTTILPPVLGLRDFTNNTTPTSTHPVRTQTIHHHQRSKTLLIAVLLFVNSVHTPTHNALHEKIIKNNSPLQGLFSMSHPSSSTITHSVSIDPYAETSARYYILPLDKSKRYYPVSSAYASS
jgi:hypothetical protein